LNTLIITNNSQQDHKTRWKGVYQLARLVNGDIRMTRRAAEGFKNGINLSRPNELMFRKARDCLSARNYPCECGSRLYHLLAMDKRPVCLLQDEQTALLKKLSLTNNAR
jgi:hypothetical protein